MVLISLCPAVRAQDFDNPDNRLMQYRITNWDTDDGLVSNTVIYLAQDADGFIWIGSYDGLMRFNGTQFTNFSKRNIPEIESFHARVLTVDKDGNLWIGTGFGLVRHHQGVFTNMAGANHKLFIESIWYDQANNRIWLGTRDSGLFVYDIQTGTYEQIDNRLKKDLINAIIPDNQNGVWVGSEKNGLAYFNGVSWRHFGQEEGLKNSEINALYFDEKEGLIIGTTSGLFQYDGKRFSSFQSFERLRINRIKKDAHGRLWVATVVGLHLRDKGTWQVLTREDGLSNNDIRDVLFDRDGNIWVATYRGGLNKLMENNFLHFSKKHGLTSEATGAMSGYINNSFLVASTDGELFQLQNGVAKKFQLKTTINQRIYSILFDKNKNLWLGSYDGLLLKKPDGTEKLFTEKDGLPTTQIRIVFQDSRGDMWLGTRTNGLIRMRFRAYPEKPIFESFIYNKLNELNSTFIMSIEEDVNGNLLIGSNTGGVNIISPSGNVQHFSISEGLTSNVTFSARQDDDGVLWVATSDGLSRIENGQVFNFSSDQGIPQESIYDVVDDRLGFLWMPSGKGIIRVSKIELDNYRSGISNSINWKLYDKSNELVSSECTGATKAFILKDGTLWFFVLGGLVSIDPSKVSPDTSFPQVYLEQVRIDDKEIPWREKIVVPPNARRVSFHFLGLNLRYPKSLRYRYRLENFDPDWISAQSRHAVYTNLPAGDFTFHVQACNSDGVWAEGASVSFSVKPRLYQTWWFYALLILVIGISLLVYFRIRIWGLKNEAKRLEQMVRERTVELAAQRDELVNLNHELRARQQEVVSQRDALSTMNTEIAKMNENLEKIVAERTRVLEDQNRRLSRYAFINAHKLRAPLASILGIINLLTLDDNEQDRALLLKNLKKSSVDLDRIVKSINKMLEEEFQEEDLKSPID
jgi:ligand-binding sensor domain-containing protein